MQTGAGIVEFAIMDDFASRREQKGSVGGEGLGGLLEAATGLAAAEGGDETKALPRDPSAASKPATEGKGGV